MDEDVSIESFPRFAAMVSDFALDAMMTMMGTEGEGPKIVITPPKKMFRSTKDGGKVRGSCDLVMPVACGVSKAFYSPL